MQARRDPIFERRQPPMSETQPTFAPELSAAPPLPARGEYLERQDRARAALAEAELDGLLAFGSRNWAWAVRWLADHQSGFQQQGASPTFGDKGFSALVLPVDGPPILVLDQRAMPREGAADDAPTGARLTTGAAPPILVLDQRAMPGECAVDDARTVERITAGVATALADAGLVGKRIGIAGEGVMLDRHRREIEAGVGGPLNLVPADKLIEPLHRVKSPAELDCMRYASSVGGAWMAAMMEAAEPGRTEADLVAIGLPLMPRGGGLPCDVVAGSGNPAKPQAPRGIPSFNATRPLEVGDLLRLDTVGTVRGYDCDMARSTCVG